MNTKLDWFEIPATNITRAIKFYETIFATTLKTQEMGPNQLGLFTDDQGVAFGALCKGPGFVPSHEGSLLYLNAGANIDDVLNRVDAAGGSIQMDKLVLPNDIGTIAAIIDTEGNRVGLHTEP